MLAETTIQNYAKNGLGGFGSSNIHSNLTMKTHLQLWQTRVQNLSFRQQRFVTHVLNRGGGRVLCLRGKHACNVRFHNADQQLHQTRKKKGGVNQLLGKQKTSSDDPYLASRIEKCINAERIAFPDNV